MYAAFSIPVMQELIEDIKDARRREGGVRGRKAATKHNSKKRKR